MRCGKVRTRVVIGAKTIAAIGNDWPYEAQKEGDMTRKATLVFKIYTKSIYRAAGNKKSEGCPKCWW